MRVRASGDRRLEEFDTWTVSLGDGSATDDSGFVPIPDQMFHKITPNTSLNQKAEEQSITPPIAVALESSVHFCISAAIYFAA